MNCGELMALFTHTDQLSVGQKRSAMAEGRKLCNASALAEGSPAVPFVIHYTDAQREFAAQSTRHLKAMVFAQAVSRAELLEAWSGLRKGTWASMPYPIDGLARLISRLDWNDRRQLFRLLQVE